MISRGNDQSIAELPAPHNLQKNFFQEDTYKFLPYLTILISYNFPYFRTYSKCTEKYPKNRNQTERTFMTDPNRIKQAVAAAVFTSILAVSAYEAKDLPPVEVKPETQSVHMTCEKEKKNKDIVTAAAIGSANQSRNDIEYEELNGSVQTVVYAKQQVTLTREHPISNVLLTAYEASEVSCGESADGITKTGTKVAAGRTVAVDPDVIPLGSQVVINGHTYTAEDIGGKVKGNHIDIYMDTVSECLNFGTRYADAVWLEEYEAVQTVKYTFEDGTLVSQEIVEEEVIE